MHWFNSFRYIIITEQTKIPKNRLYEFNVMKPNQIQCLYICTGMAKLKEMFARLFTLYQTHLFIVKSHHSHFYLPISNEFERKGAKLVLICMLTV